VSDAVKAIQKRWHDTSAGAVDKALQRMARPESIELPVELVRLRRGFYAPSKWTIPIIRVEAFADIGASPGGDVVADAGRFITIWAALIPTLSGVVPTTTTTFGHVIASSGRTQLRRSLSGSRA
jgi:hypothetical protein